MSKKLIIFDLDGVLVETKDIHFNTLNKALSEINNKFIISEEEHIREYDGLKTNQKLDLLTKQKGLDKKYHYKIWIRKQELTLNELSKITKDDNLIEMFIKLKYESDVKIACCSNSIRKSVNIMLSRLGIIEYFDLIVSNEDVKNSKPHPEMYWKTMSEFNVLPEETLIIEDSPIGLLGANRSGSEILRVKSPKDLTINKIIDKLENNININKNPKWIDDKLNILIPCAGAGSRFTQAGYTFPKPLIEVNGKPMIQVVVENLNINANYIFVVQKEHVEKYNLDSMLKLIAPGCIVIEIEGITEGAACTTLLAKKFINNDRPLLMANSDQFLEWNSNEFMYKMNENNVDGGIVTFESNHPKWSFAKLDNLGYVTEVAEKNPISNIATTGIYYWTKGSDYIKYTEQMINKNIRVNNEFYVCPVYNEAINDGKKIKTFNIERMWGIGTPEDLKYYIKNYK